MPKGIVYWSNKELWVKWEITKANQTKWSKSTPVKDANITKAMEAFKNTSQEFEVEVELEKGTAGKIVFSEKEIETNVEIEQKQREELRRQQEAKRLENEKQEDEEQIEKEVIPRKPIDLNYSKDFYNPYNFVPAMPREGITGELADCQPCGHDRFHPEMLSGKLTVKMTVETPIVALDTARVEMQGDHKKFPVRVGEDGKPFINPTAVKGMLRSAYEAITNSRMSVFIKHDERLAFRREAKSPIPVIIVKDGENYFVKPLEYQKVDNQVMNHVAKLPRYEKKSRRLDKGEDFAALRYSDKTLPKHEDAVWVKYIKVKAGAEVQEIKRRQDGENLQGEWKAGWVCVTGANINGKRFERVFLDIPNALTIPVKKELWEELIRNYQEIHQKELEKRSKDDYKPTDYLGDTPGRTAWSRHIYEKNAIELKHGTLCYAEIENKTVKSIFPVMISRQLFEKSPAELLDGKLKPAKDLNELSPADRVFGCVIKNSEDKKKANAYRGQIRIGAVVLSEDSAKKPIDQIIHRFEKSSGVKNWLPMNILGQPKPQQGRFYVAKDKHGNAQTEQGTNEESGYNGGSGLRGRKVYPHHAGLPTDHWFEKKDIDFQKVEVLKSGNQFREYLRPPGDKQQNNQNRSIEGWIKPKTEFEFEINFTNLSKVELGALIWLLQLPENHFHRFGGGKPLGFGSVRLAISKYQINDGSELTGFYKSLDSKLEEIIKLNENTEEFEKHLNETFIKPFTEEIEKAKYQKIIKSFLCACKGFADKPTHYPRTNSTPNAEGKSFEWFVDNSSKTGFKLTLPNLTDEVGLPLKPKTENQNNQRNDRNRR